jgi:hypothetical protein
MLCKNKLGAWFFPLWPNFLTNLAEKLCLELAILHLVRLAGLVIGRWSIIVPDSVGLQSEGWALIFNGPGGEGSTQMVRRVTLRDWINIETMRNFFHAYFQKLPVRGFASLHKEKDKIWWKFINWNSRTENREGNSWIWPKNVLAKFRFSKFLTNWGSDFCVQPSLGDADR